MNIEVTPVEQRAFLIAAVAWQESLLQSYRSFHLTIQGFFIAAGAVVLAVQLSGTGQQQIPTVKDVISNLIFTLIVGLLFLLEYTTAVDFKRVVQSRGKNINHWHKELMMLENQLVPLQRSFTFFKTWQRSKQETINDDDQKMYLGAEGVTEDKAKELISTDVGHTRQVLDGALFNRLQLVWYFLLFFSSPVTFYFICMWLSPRFNKAVRCVSLAT